jgi:hypothetical protein
MERFLATGTAECSILKHQDLFTSRQVLADRESASADYFRSIGVRYLTRHATDVRLVRAPARSLRVNTFSCLPDPKAAWFVPKACRWRIAKLV